MLSILYGILLVQYGQMKLRITYQTSAYINEVNATTSVVVQISFISSFQPLCQGPSDCVVTSTDRHLIKCTVWTLDSTQADISNDLSESLHLCKWMLFLLFIAKVNNFLVPAYGMQLIVTNTLSDLACWRVFARWLIFQFLILVWDSEVFYN